MDYISNFFQIGPVDPTHLMTGTYDHRFVFLSYLVAVFASFIALDICGRLRDLDNTRLSRRFWFVGGAVAMGAGIWSMHFIGMLAFNMGMPMNYAPGFTALSMIVAIFASMLALYFVKTPQVKMTRLIISGVLMGIAIVCMHYVGMEAMKISVDIRYRPDLFLLSVVIAIIASIAALWLAIFTNRRNDEKSNILFKLLGALIMGAAICGMHYTGMAAAIFTMKTQTPVMPEVINPKILSVLIAIVTFLILGMAFIASTYKQILTRQLILARKAGMAEVAENILHNMGNAMNSVNVSAILVKEKLRHLNFAKLAAVRKLIMQYTPAGNVAEDPKQNKLINDYLFELEEFWVNEQAAMVSELGNLANSIQHIKDIITAQQSLSGVATKKQRIDLEPLVEEAFIIADLQCSNKQIKVERHFKKIKAVAVEKVKLVQVIVNLLQNAVDALVCSQRSDKTLILTLDSTKDKCIIKVADNGVGIHPDDLKQIFRHGFTTKKSGHGYGLHASALDVKEMGGQIKVESTVNIGTTFTIELPYA